VVSWKVAVDAVRVNCNQRSYVSANGYHTICGALSCTVLRFLISSRFVVHGVPLLILSIATLFFPLVALSTVTGTHASCLYGLLVTSQLRKVCFDVFRTDRLSALSERL
jgi:hypothetical protein